MRLKTRLTEKLGIEHPILLAPMNVIAGGQLAAAVSDAGGLGIIGGGYGDADWLEQQFAAAGNARVGCGFITWSMARDPKLLDQVLAKQPAALMLSFGEVEPHASRIRAQGVPLICQVQGMRYLREAVDAGADIIVAEGCEAGGHSGYRGVFTLVPEAADYLAKRSPDTDSGRGRRRGRRPRPCCGAHARCRRRSCRNALRREPGIGSAGRISPGYRPRRRRLHAEIDLGRRCSEALLAQPGIRSSRSEEQLCCQVARARARDGEGHRCRI